MRQSLLVLCLLLPAGGCARKAPPVASKSNLNGLTPAVSARPAQTDPAFRRSEGRTAPEWGEQLLETRNHATRQQAALALADLGEQGYPHLAAGLRSNSDELRLASIQAMDKPTLLAHQNEMIPLFTRLLRDREPMLRRAAAARLCWFGTAAQGALRDLTEVATTDPMPDIREVARVSIDLIQNAKAQPDRGVNPSMVPPQGNR